MENIQMMYKMEPFLILFITVSVLSSPPDRIVEKSPSSTPLLLNDESRVIEHVRTTVDASTDTGLSDAEIEHMDNLICDYFEGIDVDVPTAGVSGLKHPIEEEEVTSSKRLRTTDVQDHSADKSPSINFTMSLFDWAHRAQNRYLTTDLDFVEQFKNEFYLQYIESPNEYNEAFIQCAANLHFETISELREHLLNCLHRIKESSPDKLEYFCDLLNVLFSDYTVRVKRVKNIINVPSLDKGTIATKLGLDTNFRPSSLYSGNILEGDMFAYKYDLENEFVIDVTPDDSSSNSSTIGNYDVSDLIEANEYLSIRDVDEMVDKNMETFLSILNNKRLPKPKLPCQSRLSQVVTAAIIIIQESGLMDVLCRESDFERVNNKFILETLFPSNDEDTVEFNERNRHLVDSLDLNQLNPTMESLNINRIHNQFPYYLQEYYYYATITFATSLFPLAKIVNGEFRADVEDALSDVLQTKMLRVLVHRNDKNETGLFSVQLLSGFWHKLMLMVTRVISKYYFGNFTDLKLVYVPVSRPCESLYGRQGHMSALYFMMHDTPSGDNLLADNFIQTAIPVVSHSVHIIVHRKHGIENLDMWYRFTKLPPHGLNKVVLTNLVDSVPIIKELDKCIRIFSIPIMRFDLKSLIIDLDAKRALGAVVWGFNFSELYDTDYDHIPLPFDIKQGPLFHY